MLQLWSQVLLQRANLRVPELRGQEAAEEFGTVISDQELCAKVERLEQQFGVPQLEREERIPCQFRFASAESFGEEIRLVQTVYFRMIII